LVSLLNNLRTPCPAETAYSIIDNIESNIYTIAVDTAGAAEELSSASDYQRKAGRRAACLGLVVIIVIAVVLIAVRRRFLRTTPC
jgi:t-SNARE complex subunit (syntaxin)